MDDLLTRGKRQIDSRRGGYGGKENSFEFIARRWRVWFKNNFDVDLSIDGMHVASLMVDFKKGRAEARRAAGVEPHPDDNEDAVAYEQWAEWLDARLTRQLKFNEINDEDDTVEIPVLDD